MKKTSKAVKDSRARRGVMPTSLALTEEERAEIDTLAQELGETRKGAILEAVRSYRQQGGLTKARLMLEIERRLK